MDVGDLTRSTFDVSRHYAGVRMQQGRVQLDADWNEQLDIQAHRDGTEAIDVIGPSGTPKVGGGFALTQSADGTDLLLSPGRMWVDGSLCELDASTTTASLAGADVTVGSLVVDGAELLVHDWVELTGGDGTTALVRVSAVDTATSSLTLDPAPPALPAPVVARRIASYARQPDLPVPPFVIQANPGDPPVLELADGQYFAYLDVWTRGVTALDDPEIRERALGGPDTSTRARTVWQVKLLALEGPPADLDCTSDLSQWTASLAGSTGTMRARAEPDTSTANLCTPTPAGGFTGLENQLYRVQVHDVASEGTPSIVWSRDNASVVTAWLSTTGDKLEVASIGPDAVLGFAGDQWVELIDDGHELAGQPGTLVRLLKAEGTSLRVDTTSSTGSIDRDDFALGIAKARRWDSDGAVVVTFDTWIELENGVQVSFGPGTYRVGDYWLVPARTALADVDWPVDSADRPLARRPAGIAHRVGRIGIVHVLNGTITVTDCRDAFPVARVERRAYRYVQDGRGAVGSLEDIDRRRHAGAAHRQGDVHEHPRRVARHQSDALHHDPAIEAGEEHPRRGHGWGRRQVVQHRSDHAVVEGHHRGRKIDRQGRLGHGEGPLRHEDLTMADTDLTSALLGLGYQELFLFLDRAALDDLWSGADAPQRLRRLAEDQSADMRARFLAAEVIWERDPSRPPRAPDLGAVYAAALREAVTGVANPWGLPGAGNGVVAGHVAALEPHSSAPAFLTLFDDDTGVLYAGSEDATEGNSYDYRVRDIAAELVARLLGLSYDVALEPARRDLAIERLRAAADAALLTGEN